MPPADLERTTTVLSIDPTVELVPANLLRFSITFSAPMEEGSATGRIRLTDSAGNDIPGTLLDMPPELWNPDRTRLTVLLEPGRIKRGLQPNLQAGPPLAEGDTFTVHVDAQLRDATGAELADAASRTYVVGPAIRTRVDPSRWSITWPSIRFDRPMDRAQVSRFIKPTVAGEAHLDESATMWTFTPATDEPFRIEVDTRLEDLAGNNLNRPFDREIETQDESFEKVIYLVP